MLQAFSGSFGGSFAPLRISPARSDARITAQLRLRALPRGSGKAPAALRMTEATAFFNAHFSNHQQSILTLKLVWFGSGPMEGSGRQMDTESEQRDFFSRALGKHPSLTIAAIAVAGVAIVLPPADASSHLAELKSLFQGR